MKTMIYFITQTLVFIVLGLIEITQRNNAIALGCFAFSLAWFAHAKAELLMLEIKELERKLNENER